MRKPVSWIFICGFNPSTLLVDRPRPSSNLLGAEGTTPTPVDGRDLPVTRPRTRVPPHTTNRDTTVPGLEGHVEVVTGYPYGPPEPRDRDDEGLNSYVNGSGLGQLQTLFEEKETSERNHRPPTQEDYQST